MHRNWNFFPTSVRLHVSLCYSNKFPHTLKKITVPQWISFVYWMEGNLETVVMLSLIVNYLNRCPWLQCTCVCAQVPTLIPSYGPLWRVANQLLVELDQKLPLQILYFYFHFQGCWLPSISLSWCSSFPSPLLTSYYSHRTKIFLRLRYGLVTFFYMTLIKIMHVIRACNGTK